MLLHKCDKCGTDIPGPVLARASIQVSLSAGYGVELCKSCAEPIIRFLKRSQLLQEQLAQRGFIESTA